jgi:hypothetical protein
LTIWAICSGLLNFERYDVRTTWNSNKKFDNPIFKLKQSRGRHVVSLCLFTCEVPRSVLPWLVHWPTRKFNLLLSVLFIYLGYFCIMFNTSKGTVWLQTLCINRRRGLLQIHWWNQNALNNRMMVGGIFCDLHKAFDSVNRNILLTKLEFYGITGPSLKLIKSYLYGRYKSVILKQLS